MIGKLKFVPTADGWRRTNLACSGKAAATNKNIYICLLEEDEILRISRGDTDVDDTIQDHRHAWKRLALEGRASSFVILLTSKYLITRAPNEPLKEVCRRPWRVKAISNTGESQLDASRPRFEVSPG